MPEKHGTVNATSSSDPSLDQLKELNAELSLGISDEDIAAYQPLVAGFVDGVRALDGFETRELPVEFPRDGGSAPDASENEYGGWSWRGSVKGGSEGPLAGRTVVVKDNVAVANMPMAAGSNLLEGYVPEYDATVVTRVLEAGGEITGKAACEDLCLSGGSHTAATGVVRNPHDKTRTAGGSSSGCGALVAAEEVDLAIGGDQGGSIRLPSSFCGIYGMKPTWGLIPLTGTFGLEHSVDNLGPMARSVEDLALLLEVISGPDGLDGRQAGIRTEETLLSFKDDVAGVKIGVVEEGFTWPHSEAAVSDTVRAGAKVLADLGAEVHDVSIPIHETGSNALLGLIANGMVDNLFTQSGTQAGGGRGWYPVSLAEQIAENRGSDPAWRMSHAAKLWALVGKHVRDAYKGRYYPMARNLQVAVVDAYEDAFSEYDVLLLPTTPTVAPQLPDPNASVADQLAACFMSFDNTNQFNLSCHPAMSLPCGRVDGLPVGMQLAAGRQQERLLLQVARAFEKTGTYTF